MPWSEKDVDRFKKGLSDKQKEQWVAVANSVLQKCLDGGGDAKKCEASAIQQANGVAGKERKAMSLSMSITKVKRMNDGRVRWRGRANSGDVDSLSERCDKSLFEDFVANYAKLEEAVSRGESVEGMNPIQLDVAHYSFFIKDRQKARVGWPTEIWIHDGGELMAQGWFDQTAIGQAAAKAVLDDEEGRIRLSLGFYPDWSAVEMVDGVLTYKGGHGRAWCDHIALTAHPVDTDTEIQALEVTMSDKNKLTMQDDAFDVLGDETLAGELEQARAKSEATPKGAVIKAEEEPKPEETEPVSEVEPEDEPEAESQDVAKEVSEEPAEEVEALSAVLETKMRAMVKAIMTDVAHQLGEQLGDQIVQIKALSDKVDALAKSDGAKVQAALNSNDGYYIGEIIKNSVQSRLQGTEATKAGPVQEAPSDIMGAIFNTK